MEQVRTLTMLDMMTENEVAPFETALKRAIEEQDAPGRPEIDHSLTIADLEGNEEPKWAIRSIERAQGLYSSVQNLATDILADLESSALEAAGRGGADFQDLDIDDHQAIVSYYEVYRELTAEKLYEGVKIKEDRVPRILSRIHGSVYSALYAIACAKANPGEGKAPSPVHYAMDSVEVGRALLEIETLCRQNKERISKGLHPQIRGKEFVMMESRDSKSGFTLVGLQILNAVGETNATSP